MRPSVLADISLWSTHEIVSRLDQQSDILVRAVKALESPRATIANEIRRKAIDRFHYGWFDEALEEFKRCLETDSTDFVSNLFVGIVLFIRNEDQRSLEYLEKAAKYAEPFSKTWVSFAWTIAAQVYTRRDEHNQALAMCKRAIQYDPTSAVAYYQQARSLAASQKVAGMSESLKRAIMLEAEHFALSSADPLLMSYPDTVQQVQASLMGQLSKEIQTHTSIGEQVQRLGRELVSHDRLATVVGEQRITMKKLRQSIDSGAYVPTDKLIKQLQQLNIEAKKITLQVVDHEISLLENQVSSRSWGRIGTSSSADTVAMTCAGIAFAFSILTWLWNFDVVLPFVAALVWGIIGYGLGKAYDFFQNLRVSYQFSV